MRRWNSYRTSSIYPATKTRAVPPDGPFWPPGRLGTICHSHSDQAPGPTAPQHNIRGLSRTQQGRFSHTFACLPPRRQTGGRRSLAGAGSPRPPRRPPPSICEKPNWSAARCPPLPYPPINTGRRHAPQYLTRGNLHQPECLFFSVSWRAIYQWADMHIVRGQSSFQADPNKVLHSTNQPLVAATTLR